MEYLKYYAGDVSYFPKDIEIQWLPEFKMAAYMYGPLPTEINARFARARNLDSASPSFLKVNENFESMDLTSTHRKVETLNETNDAEKRTNFAWSPSSLLCKRFNISRADIPLEAHTLTNSTEEIRNLPEAFNFQSSSPALFSRPNIEVFAHIFQK